jgi:hypothetical protein
MELARQKLRKNPRYEDVVRALFERNPFGAAKLLYNTVMKVIAEEDLLAHACVHTYIPIPTTRSRVLGSAGCFNYTTSLTRVQSTEHDFPGRLVAPSHVSLGFKNARSRGLGSVAVVSKNQLC